MCLLSSCHPRYVASCWNAKNHPVTRGSILSNRASHDGRRYRLKPSSPKPYCFFAFEPDPPPAALMDCFNAAARSVSSFTTLAGAAMCDSRPNQASSSVGSATVKRPSFLTGIPSRAQRCAVAGGKLRKAPMAAQPFSVPLSLFGFDAVFFFFFALTGTSLCLAHAVLCTSYRFTNGVGPRQEVF